MESETFDSYQRYVQVQCQRLPYLQHLSDFLLDSKNHPKPVRIACLEFSSTGDEPYCRDLDTKSLALILKDPYTRVGDLLGRVLIVEDLDKDVIEIIGSSLEVDPLFFATHLHASRAEVSAKKPFIPARVCGHDFLHIRHHRLFDFGQGSTPEKLLVDAAVRRKVVLFPTRSTRVGWIQENISILVRLNIGDMWLCLFLVDPHNRNKFYFDDRANLQKIGPIALQMQRFQGGPGDFLNLRFDYSKKGANQTTLPVQLSPHDDLIHYWMAERPPVFDRACPSLLSMSYYPLRIAAAEWYSFTNFMRYITEDYESSIETLQFSYTDIGKLEAYIRDLHSWRRRSSECTLKVQPVIKFIKSHNTDSSYSAMWDLVAQEYEDSVERIDFFGRRLEAMMPVVTSLVQIVDSRRSFAETASLSKLTHLALVFVPLTYVSSLFSMAGSVAPGGKAFWVYFAVAAPVLAVVLLVALPYQSGMPHITEYFRGLLRKRQRPRAEVGMREQGAV